jgi:hypothetical protein
MRLNFPEAGIWLDAGRRHYTIISTHQGGVVSHFLDGRLATLDAGVVVRGPRGDLGSTQAHDACTPARFEDGVLVVEARIRPMPKRLPTPLQFLALRILCLSVFRWRYVRERAKVLLVGWLITRQRAWPVTNVRHIHLGPDLRVADATRLARGYHRVDPRGSFVSIHMASQGYWQIQDETGPR